MSEGALAMLIAALTVVGSFLWLVLFPTIGLLWLIGAI